APVEDDQAAEERAVDVVAVREVHHERAGLVLEGPAGELVDRRALPQGAPPLDPEAVAGPCTSHPHERRDCHGTTPSIPPARRAPAAGADARPAGDLHPSGRFLTFRLPPPPRAYKDHPVGPRATPNLPVPHG